MIFDFLSTQRRILVSQGSPLTQEEKALQSAYGGDNTFLDNLMFMLVFLSSPKGQEIYELVEPVLLKLLDMLERSMVTMYQASAAQPILAVPATLLFTNICNRLYLIDDLTGKVAAASVTGINVALGIEEVISKAVNIFKLSEVKTTTLVYDLGAPTGELRLMRKARKAKYAST